MPVCRCKINPFLGAVTACGTVKVSINTRIGLVKDSNTHKGAITAFAGVDPGVNESGSYEQKSVPTSKRGSGIKIRPPLNAGLKIIAVI